MPKDGKPDETKSTEKQKKNSDEPTAFASLLAKCRPRQRFAVFAIFLAICVATVVLYDTCDVRKKKQDCGYSGISGLECRTTACFLKGGGELEKRKITITRKKGTKFGLVAGPKTKDSAVYIQAIKEGAVADHNAKLPAESEDRIEARDTITSIDGASGNIRKALSSTNTEKVVIELKRSKLPKYLRWIHRTSKVNFVEKLFTAPGFISWFHSSKNFAGMGFVFWFLSGYPPASLPFYYFGLSGVVSWHLNRCCHDSNVAGGVPHCYKGGSAKFQTAMDRIRTSASSMFAKVRKKPRSYFKWLFLLPEEYFK